MGILFFNAIYKDRHNRLTAEKIASVKNAGNGTAEITVEQTCIEGLAFETTQFTARIPVLNL